MSRNELSSLLRNGDPRTVLPPCVSIAAAALLAILAGCSSLGPYRGTLAPPPAPVPVANTEAENAPAPRPAASVTPQEAPSPLAIARPPAKILVLRSSDAETYSAVSARLNQSLADTYEMVDVNLADDSAPSMLADADPSAWTAVVAIGADAAEYAASNLQAPTIFCQIFEYAPLLERRENLLAVEPLPPLSLQLESWKALSPEARSVGIIVTEDEKDLVAEAEQAAASLGLELHAAYAVTDRDAIYQFKRFSQSVDGLWLHPNSSILSPSAIQEILDYAMSHRVETIVFSKALLDWGALMSVGSSTDDVAATVSRVLHEIVEEGGTDIERVAPLSTVDMQINKDVAARLGLPNASAALDKELVTASGDDT